MKYILILIVTILTLTSCEKTELIEFEPVVQEDVYQLRAFLPEDTIRITDKDWNE